MSFAFSGGTVFEKADSALIVLGRYLFSKVLVLLRAGDTLSRFNGPGKLQDWTIEYVCCLVKRKMYCYFLICRQDYLQLVVFLIPMWLISSSVYPKASKANLFLSFFLYLIQIMLGCLLSPTAGPESSTLSTSNVYSIHRAICCGQLLWSTSS